MRHEAEDMPEDRLTTRYHAAVPELAVNPQAVLRAGKRRRTRRRIGVATVTALGVVSAGWAASALPVGLPTHLATDAPTPTADEGVAETLGPEEQVRALADELEAQAAPVPDQQAFHFEATDWITDSEGRVQLIGLQRTSNPDGTIYQVEVQTEWSADLSVGDPIPADAQRTESGPMSQSRPDWTFEEDLPVDPEDLRAAWLESCGVDPSVGHTEYRCLYVGMQETVPIATDEMAASVLRLLVDEPDVTIEEITDQLGRDHLAATFDLPDEGRISYLIDPETGRIDGMQTEDEHSTTVSRWTTEWIDPMDGF